ncbi:hypothetical protein [Vibrio hepatarius]|jgi:hypothetical protein|uniref:Uncharacterized protein n=1 Tax=Vibrio hepatarius TaxID=171383 RepID=A0A0M0HKY3_9VIBR|nr:hypothetical protein [Vibrio hepatarius]KOO02725.1 hypothetical protein AKJ31_22315 [Vibrio hepatarius]
MTNKESIESLKALLYGAKIIYSWEYKGAGLKHENLAKWGGAIISSAFPFGFIWYVTGMTTSSSMFWVFLVIATLMIFAARYLFFPDKHRCYHLTSLGVHYTKQDMIPEVAYKIARDLAWVGVAVCIIAVFVLGPLAFVGAGALALMAFRMTNFQPTVDKSYVFMDERSILFNLINDYVLSFTVPGKGQMQYKGLIFTSNQQEKEELLNHIRSLFHDIEIVQIKRRNDQYKHLIYQQDEEEVVE